MPLCATLIINPTVEQKWNMAEIKKAFTENFITLVKPKKTEQIFVDKYNPNLKLYVRPSGAKSYYFRAKLNGKDTRRKIGAVNDVSLALARVLAENYLKGRNPQVQITKKPVCFHRLALFSH